MKPTKKLHSINQIKLFFKLFLFAILFVLVMSSTSWAATYYVDATNGDNSNPGTSEDAPWKSIWKVNSNSFQPGDFILFKRGETWSEQLNVPSSGSSENIITIGAYGNGGNPVITGAYFGIEINNKSYLTIEDLEITAVTGTDGIIIRNGSRYINLNNIISHGNPDYGIRIESDNIIVNEGNFYNNLKLGGIGVYNAKNVTIQNAVIHDNTEDGIWATNTTDLVISGNKIFNHVNGSGLAMGSPDGIQIKNSRSVAISNNLIYNSSNAGIIIGNTSGGSIKYNIIFNNQGAITFTSTNSETFEVYNNTLYHSISDELLFLNPIDQAHIIVKNNIFCGDNGRSMRIADGVASSPITLDYNLYHTSGTTLIRYNSVNYNTTNFADYQTASSQEANSIASYPLFTKTGTEMHEQLALQFESPCLDAGVDVGLSMDFFERKIFDLPDIGAIEFQRIVPPKRFRVLY